MNVWVVTVGVQCVFDSAWITKKLAWQHVMVKARAYTRDLPDYIQKSRFHYPPEKTLLMIQGHHKETPKRTDTWEILEVYHLNEEHVHGDAVAALAEVLDESALTESG